MMWRPLSKSFLPDLPRWKFLIIVLHTFFVLLLAGLASKGYPAISWMDFFDPGRDGGWDQFPRFVWELKTGVPPIQSICELVVYNLTGNFGLFSQVLYRMALVFVYLAALYWRTRSDRSFVFAMFTGTVFLWSTVLLHPLMPMTYDLFFPALGFVFLLLQPVQDGAGRGNHWIRTRCFLSGVALSLFELTRPFVLMMLPFLLLGSLSALRPYGRKCLLLHLLPLLILSGGWHLKLFLLHEGQIVWSNHSGFNLFRAWKDFGIEEPLLVDETGQPAPWNDPGILNTPVHSRHNEILKTRILEAMLQQPVAALQWSWQRLVSFLRPGVTMYRSTPCQHPVLWLYPPLVWISSLWLFWNFFRFLWGMVKALVGPRGQSGLCLQLAGRRENQLIVMAFLSMVILAMGESGEEVRLLISVLPWMAAYPLAGVSLASPGQSLVSPSICAEPGV